MTTVQVRFATSSNLYDYIYDLSAPVKVGDNLVVDSPYSGLAIVKVVSIKETGGTKYVVAKIDLTEYEERQAKLAKVKKLRTELDKKMKSLESTLKYQMLANLDPEARVLIDELRKLEI